MLIRFRFSVRNIIMILTIAFGILWFLPMREVYAAGEPSGGGKQEAEHGIPVIYITVDESKGTIDAMNSDPEHKTSCTGTMDIVVPEGFRYTDRPDTELSGVTGLSMTIRGRGNSTWKYDKKPYKIKLDKKTPLLGFGSNKHWVLLANYSDPTLIRDRFTGWLGKEMGFTFTPQCVPVDVVMNGTYLGSYNLAEQVRVGDNRLELDELKEEDTDPGVITGGYLLQYGQQVPTDSPSAFTTNRDELLADHTPNFDPEDGGYTNEAQMTYIRSHIQKVEDALYNKNHNDKNGISVWDYMDLTSAADYWLIQQISMNGDAYVTGSTYLYKVRDKEGTIGKIYWGPLWDFDIAWGLIYPDEEENTDLEMFVVEDPWVAAMLYDPAFYEKLAADWPKLRETLNAATKEGGLLDRYYEETKASKEADQALWNSDEAERTYRETINAMKRWIDARVAWFDRHLTDLKTRIKRITWKIDGQEDSYSYYPETGRIFFRKLKKEGYIFLGWQKPDGTMLEEDENVYATADCVYTAVFFERSKATKANDIHFAQKQYWSDLDLGYDRLSFTLFPVDAQDKTVIWTSSDPGIAKISEEGNIEMLREGTVTITAELPTGKKKSVEFTIVRGAQAEPASVSITPADLKIKAGTYQGLTIDVYPHLAGIGSIMLESADPDIADVSNYGVVHAKKTGDTKILVTVFSSSGETEIHGECRVHVTDSQAEPSGGGNISPEPGDAVPGTGRWKKDKKGWWYDLGHGAYYRKCWQKIDGIWYYFKEDGYMASKEWCKGYWLDKNGAWTYQRKAFWRKDRKGWWYGNGKWYAKDQWQKIDGIWYFFDKNGYMVSGEWISGYWLDKSGAWTYQRRASWRKDSTGWWYGDGKWYAKDQWQKIDGIRYSFDKKGYLIK